MKGQPLLSVHWVLITGYMLAKTIPLLSSLHITLFLRSDQFKTSWLQTLKLLKKGSNFKPLLICMNLFLALHLCGMGPFIFFSSR